MEVIKLKSRVKTTWSQMTPVLKAIPAILLSMPMAAQSPWVAAQLDNNTSAFLLYLGERSGSLYEGLQELLRTDELVEMGLYIRPIQADWPNYVKWISELGLARDSAWALVDRNGRCLLQGNKPPGAPSAAEVRNALDAAGVKSPIRVLRDFLKQHPGHLDARQELLSRLRTIAVNRTRHALQLNIKEPDELMIMGDVEGHYRSMSQNVFDTSLLEGKQLSPEEDIVIWGPYAQEFQALSASGEWRLLNWGWVQHAAPIEACSPTMIQIYRRHITRLEACLEEMPSNLSLWQNYSRTFAITKQNSVRALLDRLVPGPGMDWPIPSALFLLISQERAKGNWELVAETLMSNWPSLRKDVNLYFEFTIDYKSSEFDKGWVEAWREISWRDYLNPLLESLIKTNRIAEAETIILDVARYSAYRDFQRRAAELASNCGRSDLQAKWLAFQIPEKPDEPDMNDLEVMFYSNNSTTPRLVVINTEEADLKQVSAVLRQSKLLDWDIDREYFHPALLELMRQREGWPKDIAYWALFDTKNNVIAHGAGLPTEEALYQALEQSGIETTVSALRRFIREHPWHVGAKESLLGRFKRLAEQKTKESLGEGVGVNTVLLLSEEDDRAIWGEYASLYRQALPYYLEQCRLSLDWIGYNPCDSEYFIHSQTMRNLAPALLPQIEERLMRQPEDEHLWVIWSSLSDLVEPWRFTDIKENLVLQPYAYDPASIPASSARWPLLERCSARSNWQRIIDIQEWRWEAMRAKLELDPTNIREYLWPDEMKYLLEAYLRLEKNNEANELVRIFSQSPEWPKIKQSAVELAEKCGKGALAELWEKL